MCLGDFQIYNKYRGNWFFRDKKGGFMKILNLKRVNWLIANCFKICFEKRGLFSIKIFPTARIDCIAIEKAQIIGLELINCGEVCVLLPLRFN